MLTATMPKGKLPVLEDEGRLMLGERPSGLDAVAYGFIETNVAVPFDNPVQRFLQAEPALVTYRERMRARYWG